MRFSKWWLAIAASAVLLGCSDEEVIEANPLPIIEQTKVRYETLWSKPFGEGVQDQFLKLRPASGYGKIFVADVSGKVSAFSPEKGELVWQVDLGIKISAGVSVANQMVVVAGRNGEVVALNESDGQRKWQVEVTSEVIANPAIGDGYVVVNSVDGVIVALNADSGNRAWFYDRSLPPLTLRGTSAPVVAHGAAIAGFANGKVGVFILENGQLAWEKQVTAPSGRSDLERLVDIDSQPIIFGGTLYAGSYNGNLMAMELRSGEALWSRELSAYHDMAIDNQTLLITHDNGYVSSVNRNNGALIWTQKALFLRETTAPTAFNDHIVVGDFGGYLHMLDKSDGVLIGQMNINADVEIADCYQSQEECRFHNHYEYGVASAPLVVDDTLFVQTGNGHLIAYKQRQE